MSIAKPVKIGQNIATKQKNKTKKPTNIFLPKRYKVFLRSFLKSLIVSPFPIFYKLSLDRPEKMRSKKQLDLLRKMVAKAK